MSRSDREGLTRRESTTLTTYYLSKGEMSRSDREGLTVISASEFKQFFSSPSLVFKLGENFVIEIQLPAQGFRKEQLETIIPSPTGGRWAELGWGLAQRENKQSLQGRADLRTDDATQLLVRIANRLSIVWQSHKCETLRAWSKFKTEKNFLMSKANLEIQERVLHSVDKIATHPLLSLRDILSTGEVGGAKPTLQSWHCQYKLESEV